MVTVLEEENTKVKKIFKGQRWCTLSGDFTIDEVESILAELKEANKNLPK